MTNYIAGQNRKYFNTVTSLRLIKYFLHMTKYFSMIDTRVSHSTYAFCVYFKHNGTYYLDDNIFLLNILYDVYSFSFLSLLRKAGIDYMQ